MDANLPQNVNSITDAPPTENVGKKIVMFGSPTCPDCMRIKKYFAENAIEYEYIDVSTNKLAFKWINNFTQTNPVLIMLDGSLLYSPSTEKLHQFISGNSVNGKVTMVEPEMFDVVIVGGGPAGLTAAIYAVRKSLKALLITKTIGGQASLSGDIENYLGFSLITGSDLADKFREDVEKFKGEGIWIKEGVEVKGIEGAENDFTVKTDSSEYKCKTIIIASGRVPRMLNIPGEKELLGKGVATCATCDGPLYKGKDVAVIGGGNSALDAAFSLMKVARSVKVINLTGQVNGDSILMANVTKAKNVQILNNSSAVKINGTNFVESLVIQNGQDHQEQILDVQGVFIEIGWIPAVDFVPQLAKDKENQIIVDEFGATNIPGIWAAGDVNNLWGEQIVIAAGEGAKTALSVAEHIAKIPHQATSNIHES